jgi:hypothetical protein
MLQHHGNVACSNQASLVTSDHHLCTHSLLSAAVRLQWRIPRRPWLPWWTRLSRSDDPYICPAQHMYVTQAGLCAELSRCCQGHDTPTTVWLGPLQGAATYCSVAVAMQHTEHLGREQQATSIWWQHATHAVF